MSKFFLVSEAELEQLERNPAGWAKEGCRARPVPQGTEIVLCEDGDMQVLAAFNVE